MWKTKYTGIVGRNRKNAVRTADSGISSRGNGVFISSLPEETTERVPVVIAVATMLNANRPRVRWAKNDGSCRPRMMVTST